MNISSNRKIVAMLGFVIMGLSPAFVDWSQSPEKRAKRLAFYAVGLTFVYVGLLS